MDALPGRRVFVGAHCVSPRILYAPEYTSGTSISYTLCSRIPKKKKERLLGVPQVSGDMALGVAQLHTMH